MKPFLLTFAVFAVGCGVGNEAMITESAGESADDSYELWTTRDTFLMARRDLRKCMAPLCGGYWVKDLNSTMKEKYVSGFDFSGSDLSDEVQGQVASAGDWEVVIYGRLGPRERRFNTRPILALAAYRGMPGQTFSSTDKFYRVFPSRIACITTPCANLQTTRLNRTTGHTMATDVDVSGAQASLVDPNYLLSRAINGRAVIAGSIVRANGHVTVTASQIFVQLPDRLTACPRQPAPVCATGEVPAYFHNSDRCTEVAGCTEPRFCAAYVPSCDPGYTQVSWQNGCTQYACEPDFLQ